MINAVFVPEGSRSRSTSRNCSATEKAFSQQSMGVLSSWSL